MAMADRRYMWYPFRQESGEPDEDDTEVNWWRAGEVQGVDDETSSPTYVNATTVYISLNTRDRTWCGPAYRVMRGASAGDCENVRFDYGPWSLVLEVSVSAGSFAES